MTINLSLPATHELKPKITVVGVGGAGGNAVNNMITSHLEGVEFIACNTDAQALSACLTDRKIQLGATITHGLGAGARPEVGRAAAEEALDEILDALSGSHMVFITGGMGGGTGTGAAPVIARAVREQGILTVGVVTKPFHFEGAHRMRLAEGGLEELQQHVDTLIVIPNQNLFRLANERTTFSDAFRMADEVLHMGVRGVTDLMIMPGLINLDFADIRTVMSEMGKAMMGTGEAEGDRRALEAAEAAISNPLLDEVSMKGARAVLINITGGLDMTLFEVDAAANRIREEVDPNANIIFGSTFNETMQGEMRVSVVATGIASEADRKRAAAAAAAAAEPAPVAERAPASPLPVFRFQPQGAKPAMVSPSPVQAGPVTPRPSRALAEPAARPMVEAMAEQQAPAKGFVPAPAADGGRQPAGAAEPARGSNLFDKFKGLAFSRTTMTAPLRPGRPIDAVEVRERATIAAEQDEIGEIPAFLRKQHEHA
ncbi:MAG TPA: cell division protein FtsZ [Geminicoccaceae bacterium]|nr:cell division protein FtsZ [Geminicoccus sp.]HMU50219.1 cell division protein FtsZ [Geminicoccaceae bacterium]